MDPIASIEVSPAGEETAELVAVGDFCLRSGAGGGLSANSPASIFDADLLSVCRGRDLLMVNLECALAAKGPPIVKCGPNLVGAPETIGHLQALGCNVATLANNHILDYGADSMFATRQMCEEAGIRTVGVGRNLEEACSALILDVRGIKVAVVALAEEEFSCAGPDTPGAGKLDLPGAADAVRKAAAQAHIVVAGVHGGNELYPIPSPRVQSWYRHLVDCGADAVIGHHPHTIQGMEVYQSKPILYSLGNFAFPWASEMPRCWYTGLLVRLVFSRRGVHGLEVYGTRQTGGLDDVRVALTGAAEQEALTQRFRQLCDCVADAELLGDYWRCFCRDRRDAYVMLLKGTTGVLAGNTVGFLKTAVKRKAPHLLAAALGNLAARFVRSGVRSKDLATLCNVLRCPAHREVITTILEMENGERSVNPDSWSNYAALMRECR